jgi:hypothetical protein
MKKIFLRIGLVLFDLAGQRKSDLKVAVAGQLSGISIGAAPPMNSRKVTRKD